MEDKVLGEENTSYNDEICRRDFSGLVQRIGEGNSGRRGGIDNQQPIGPARLELKHRSANEIVAKILQSSRCKREVERLSM